LARKARPRLRMLRDELLRAHPEITDPEELIRSGTVLVHGRAMTNPSSLVPAGTPVVLRRPRTLRGEAKLRAALAAFAVDPSGRVALDVGAAAGGFTRVLLDAGARRVYAVDVGHGQLLGSLRQDSRVVALERTNLADLDERRVPDVVELVTIDVSYLALSTAAPQIDRVRLAPRADAVALVKPQFELGLARPPDDPAELRRALLRAVYGFEAAGWEVRGTIESPVRGSHGAAEFLLHAVAGRCRP
jgi:23S rRNA (cytidine1920-2'-O)/16S rRNA (cytidine1409-2'-O)-methyltransferase